MHILSASQYGSGLEYRLLRITPLHSCSSAPLTIPFATECRTCVTYSSSRLLSCWRVRWADCVPHSCRLPRVFSNSLRASLTVPALEKVGRAGDGWLTPRSTLRTVSSRPASLPPARASPHDSRGVGIVVSVVECAFGVLPLLVVQLLDWYPSSPLGGARSTLTREWLPNTVSDTCSCSRTH